MIQKIKYISLAVFIITAFFSVGYIQADEYFQIIEFAQYKLGRIEASELPWEFHERMRPTLQPWIAYFLIKFFNFFNLINPFYIDIVLRLITAIFLWLTFTRLNTILIAKYFEELKWKNLFYGCTLLLWFVPFVSVHFTSENYASLFLLWSLILLINKSKSYLNLAIVGFTLGISFLFRYQMGIAILAIYAYLLFIEKIKIWKIVLSGSIILILMGIETYFNSIFYNQFTFAPYNYLKLNLIDGKAASFGTSPFFAYIYLFLGFVIPPISFVLLTAYTKGIIVLKKNIFVWVSVFFILIHSLIGHKEMRFLFPVMYLFIFISVYGLKEYFKNKAIKKWQIRTFKVSLVINSILLLFMMYKPMNGTVKIYEYIYDNISEKNNIVISTSTDTYYFLSSLKSSFYRPKNVTSLALDSNDKIKNYLTENNIENAYLVHNQLYFTDNIENYNIERVYSVYPNWIKNINFIDLQKIIKTKTVYKITKNIN